MIDKYIIYKNQVIGKGAYGNVYLGAYAPMKGP